MNDAMDKLFLLSYAGKGYDGLLHLRHAWFGTEEELKAFVRESERKNDNIEVNLAIEILSWRIIVL